MNVCVWDPQEWLQLASLYMAEVSLYFRQVFPLLLNIQSQSRVCMHNLELQSQPQALLNALSHSGYSPHSLRAVVQVRGHGVHTRTRRQTWTSSQKWRFYALLESCSVSCFSALAGRFSVEVVDPRWPCYALWKTNWKRRDGKQKWQATARSRFFEASGGTVQGREKPEESVTLPSPSSPFLCLTTTSVLDLSGCFPFWWADVLEFYYLLFFFLGGRNLNVSLHTHTHTLWLLGTYAKRDWWLRMCVGWCCLSSQWCPILTCSHSLNCLFFFSTHAALAVTACSESVNSKHTAHFLTK